MTVTELAQKLNTAVPQIFEHFNMILEDIPQDENYALTTEQIKKAISMFEGEEKTVEIKLKTELKSKFDQIRLEELKSKLNEPIRKRVEILGKLELYFKKRDSSLLQEFKKHNSIVDFIFEGDFRKVTGKDFGFFKNISHQDGTILTYPISNDAVDEIFIASGQLDNDKRYSFEAAIATRHARTKNANPFLLQAKNENINEIKELSVISRELKKKKEKLDKINTNIEKTEEHFEFKKEEIAEKISKEFEKKESEAKKIIETYQETINQKLNEIQNKQQELSSLNEILESTNNNLLKMENIVSTLKERVTLCKNLQFLSEDEESKYLNLLSAKEFNPTNHLDFEKDFEKSFSKLSDHIHAYLYHKNNLIYTRYQIRNFLTLLKTHDIIVLSGLSGSGKTQIVKAFAEALGGVAKIIPVKPNWTSSDDLIGYYNPLQMSFLPTPFTEAIVEAIHNPNQLYFICIDEMNLARAEYYFADFLSKLEERSKPPEIELYANHEEELFVSEFSTLLNLIETSIKGNKITSWQEFLDNEEVRKKFFEMLGNTEKESMLQLHAKMKRRLIDILKFPSTIKIPDNVRFIGAINVDETTHYFSPKILDRIHVVKFDNPLLFEEHVNTRFEKTENKKELKPVYVQPKFLSERNEYPPVNKVELFSLTQKLKEINKNYLIPLNIDFGIRSIRQSINYAKELNSVFQYFYYTAEGGRTDRPDVSDYFEEGIHFGQVDTQDLALNAILMQKIFPRFIFDGSEIAKNGYEKIKVVEELQKFIAVQFNDFYDSYESDENDIGKSSSEYLEEMIKQANRNNSQFNFFT
jgi:MoxR-like ATPase